MAYDRAWLRTQIGNFIHDTTTGLEDTFIDMATKKVGVMLEGQANQLTTTYNIATADFPLPDEAISIRVLAYRTAQDSYLLRSVPTHQLANYNDTGVASGSPAVYSIIGGVLKIRPFIAGDYDVTTFTGVDIGPAASDTNDSLEQYPYIFLDAALVEAFDYKQDGTYAGRYESKWLGAVEQVNRVSRKLDQGDVPAMRAM